MFQEIGDLVDYWHIIALSKDLKFSKSFRNFIYGKPILVWRNEQGVLNSVLDICPHKHAPLDVNLGCKNELNCKYHGWKFSSDGNLLEIPSSPHLTSKLKCRLKIFTVKEEGGFIWIWISEKSVNKQIESFNEVRSTTWKHYYTKFQFDTSDELLIENFMDASHTPMVHNKLIRNKKIPTQHRIQVKKSNENVKITFPETNEKVGIGLNLILGKHLLVSHTDEFLFPNIVKVNYNLNGKHRFHAYIACTSNFEGKTTAYIRLSFQFPKFNFLIKFVLPFLARKILKQDFEITKLQFENKKLFPNISENCIDYDLIHNYVKIIRRNKIQQSEQITDDSEIKTIQVEV